jgi:DNA invertase Pin-like site-specific DNA recombinase
MRSGKSMDRPRLQELLAYARKGDTLAVVRLDRLGRSLTELLAIVEQLKLRGVACSAWRKRSTHHPLPAS